jgi:hypothetical protein
VNTTAAVPTLRGGGFDSTGLVFATGRHVAVRVAPLVAIRTLIMKGLVVVAVLYGWPTDKLVTSTA